MNAALPPWIQLDSFDKECYAKTLSVLSRHRVKTVCIEANCPNRYECFSHGTATFMILGSSCTRSCRYCGVRQGLHEPVDDDEPARIAAAACEFQLSHAVITSVTRDDLADGGAGQFVRVVEELRRHSPVATTELLIPDFNGRIHSLTMIAAAKPDIINHNIEVVKELFPLLRPGAGYERSLTLLRRVKELNPRLTTKSGLMLGLGEDDSQIMRTLRDLRDAGCDILTLGQYLQPSPAHAPVERYYHPLEFDELKRKALLLGFRRVLAGPLVRSSYHAGRES